MKIPRVERGRVQSLGRPDSRAVAASGEQAAATGRLQQETMNMLAGVAGDFIQRKQDAEYNTQVAEMQTEMNEWQGHYRAKEFYTADELGGIPDDQVPRTVTSNNEFGEEVTTDRKDIPAYEVYPRLLNQKLEGITKTKSDKISNPRLRREFLEKAAISNSDMVMRAMVTAETQQHAFMVKKGAMEANTAFKSGDYELGAFLVDNLEVDENVKAELLEQGAFDDEMFDVNQAAVSTDPEVVMAMRSRYTDPNYDGSLTAAQTKTAVGMFDNQLDQLSAERTARITNAQAVTASDLSVGIIEGTTLESDIEAAFDAGQANPNDPNGITPPTRTALRKQLRASERASLKVTDYRELYGKLMSGEIRGDITNNEHVKAVEQMMLDKGWTPENVKEMGVVTKRIGIMPQMLQTKLNGSILEGGPEEAELALVMYSNMTVDAPHVAMQVGSEARKVFHLANQFRAAGKPTSEAIKVARQYRTEVTPQTEDAYLKQYRDADINEAGLLQNMMDDDTSYDHGWGGFGSTSPSSDMTFDFAELTKLYVPLVKGNIRSAQAMAYADLKGKYGQTGVGMSLGGVTDVRPAKLPPELLLQATTGEVNTALKRYATASKVDFDNIMLVSTNTTLKDHTWAVLTLNPDTGEFVSHDDFEGSKWIVSAAEEQIAEDKIKASEREAEAREQLEGMTRRRAFSKPTGAQ